jgi:excisionase family DNA binding protein
MRHAALHKADKSLLQVKEAAEILDLSPITVRRAIHDGELAAVRLGSNGRYRVRRDALEAFLRPAREARP